MPQISVIVPAYKVEKYLEQCLESILNQTFADFELILVDDGSPDRCGEICDEYADRYDFITVIHKENGGLSSARNAGLPYARSEWISFVDSDDVIHPEYLRLLFQSASQCGAGMAVCNCVQAKSVPETFYRTPSEAYSERTISEESLYELYNSKQRSYWTVVPTLVKKQIVERHPFTEGRIYEDNAVSVAWLCEAEKAAFLEAPLYFYYVNPEGIVNEAFSLKKLDFLWALQEQMRYYEQIGYKRMLGAIAKEYVNTAIWLSDRTKKELKDNRSARHILKDTVTIKKKYNDLMTMTETEERKLFKAAHPLLHQIKKKIGYLKKR